MDQDTKAPSGETSSWADGITAVEFSDRLRHTFSLGDPIKGEARAEIHLTFRELDALRVITCAGHLLGTRVTVDGAEVGTVQERAVNLDASEVYVWIRFDPGVTPEQLAGKAIRLPLFELVERNAMTITLSPSPGGEPRS